MKGTATLIKSDGNIEVISFDSPVGLEELQKYVGGYIQVVPLLQTYQGENCVAFCNEEGKLNELPYNGKATDVWKKEIEPQLMGDELNDYIAGDMVIFTGDDEFLKSF